MDLFSAVVDQVCGECGMEYPRPPEVKCPVCAPPGEVGLCRSPACRKPVRWLLTDSGARMPLDEGLVAGGNVVLVHSLGGWRARVMLRGESPPGGLTWQPHWATCPDADAWRDR